MYIEKWTYYMVREEQSMCVTMLIVRLFKITYILKEPNSVSMQWTYYRVRDEQSMWVTMLIVRLFKITYRLKEQNSVSMYIEKWT